MSWCISGNVFDGARGGDDDVASVAALLRVVPIAFPRFVG